MDTQLFASHFLRNVRARSRDTVAKFHRVINLNDLISIPNPLSCTLLCSQKCACR